MVSPINTATVSSSRAGTSARHAAQPAPGSLVVFEELLGTQTPQKRTLPNSARPRVEDPRGKGKARDSRIAERAMKSISALPVLTTPPLASALLLTATPLHCSARADSAGLVDAAGCQLSAPESSGRNPRSSDAAAPPDASRMPGQSALGAVAHPPANEDTSGAGPLDRIGAAGSAVIAQVSSVTSVRTRAAAIAALAGNAGEPGPQMPTPLPAPVQADAPGTTAPAAMPASPLPPGIILHAAMPPVPQPASPSTHPAVQPGPQGPEQVHSDEPAPVAAGWPVSSRDISTGATSLVDRHSVSTEAQAKQGTQSPENLPIEAANVAAVAAKSSTVSTESVAAADKVATGTNPLAAAQAQPGPDSRHDSPSDTSRQDSRGDAGRNGPHPTAVPQMAFALPGNQAASSAAFSSASMAEARSEVQPGTAAAGAVAHSADLRAAHAVAAAVRSDLHFAVETDTFGRVTIHTSSEGARLSAQLVLENDRQSASLAVHLPHTEQRILSQHGIHASLSMDGGKAGGSRSSDAHEDNSRRPPRSQPISLPASPVGHEATSIPAYPLPADATGRLSLQA